MTFSTGAGPEIQRPDIQKFLLAGPSGAGPEIHTFLLAPTSGAGTERRKFLFAGTPGAVPEIQKFLLAGTYEGVTFSGLTIVIKITIQANSHQQLAAGGASGASATYSAATLTDGTVVAWEATLPHRPLQTQLLVLVQLASTQAWQQAQR